ncbi:hypothetical protein DWV37_13110, partial [Tannerella sp. AF04-6]
TFRRKKDAEELSCGFEDNLQQNILGYWYEFTDKEHIPFYVLIMIKRLHMFFGGIFSILSAPLLQNMSGNLKFTKTTS